MIGSTPLRAGDREGLRAADEFGQIDVDRQRDILRDKTSALFGTANLTAFADPANVEKVINRFLARAQLESGPSASTPGSAALSLLRGATSGGSAGLFNLLAARG